MPAFQRPSMSQWNGMNPLAPVGSTQVYQGWRSPMEEQMLNAPLSDDQYSLLLNKQVADKARKARLAAEIQRAQDESNFLDSIQPNETAGVFTAPGNDPRQARLQALLNRDYAGRELGSRLSMLGERAKTAATWDTQKRQMELLAQQRTYENQLADNKRADEIFRQNTEDRAQNREIRQMQIDDMGAYRDQRLGLDRERLANTTTNQTANRALQQQSLDLKKRMNEAAGSRTEFGDWVRANRSGAPVAQLDSALQEMWPRMTPANQQVAMAYMAQRAQSENAVSTTSDFYNRELLRTAQQLAQENGGTIDSHFGDAVGILNRQMSRDPNARGNILADPNARGFIPRFQLPTGNFSPTQTNAAPVDISAPVQSQPAQSAAPASAIPVPANVRGRYQEGKIYNVGGLPYRYQNGYMVR